MLPNMNSDDCGVNTSNSSWKQLNLALLSLPNVFISATVIVFFESHKFLEVIINKLVCLINGTTNNSLPHTYLSDL